MQNKDNNPGGRPAEYRITIDKTQYVVEKSSMTGRELLQLAGKTPVERFMISEKLHGGQVRKIIVAL